MIYDQVADGSVLGPPLDPLCGCSFKISACGNKTAHAALLCFGIAAASAERQERSVIDGSFVCGSQPFGLK